MSRGGCGDRQVFQDWPVEVQGMTVTVQAASMKKAKEKAQRLLLRVKKREQKYPNIAEIHY